MKFILPSIFLILATCYSPGECLKCYLCVTPRPPPSSVRNNNQDVSGGFLGGFSGAFSGIFSIVFQPCRMNGDDFDSNSESLETSKEGQKCIKSVVEVNHTTYMIRGATDKDCNAFGREVMQLVYKKSITNDKITFCGSCGSDLCNSGNSLNSFQLVFSTFAMLALLYTIF